MIDGLGRSRAQILEQRPGLAIRPTSIAGGEDAQDPHVAFQGDRQNIARPDQPGGHTAATPVYSHVPRLDEAGGQRPAFRDPCEPEPLVEALSRVPVP